MSEDDKTEAVVGSALVSEWVPTPPPAEGNALYRYVECKGKSEEAGLGVLWRKGSEECRLNQMRPAPEQHMSSLVWSAGGLRYKNNSRHNLDWVGLQACIHVEVF